MKITFTQVRFASHTFQTRANPNGFDALPNSSKIMTLRSLVAHGLSGMSQVQPEFWKALLVPHVTMYRREDNKGFTRHHFDVVTL
jgi:hypothetical protein